MVHVAVWQISMAVHGQPAWCACVAAWLHGCVVQGIYVCDEELFWWKLSYRFGHYWSNQGGIDTKSALN